jgi:uncharacterized small protein (DUF1192 family)
MNNKVDELLELITKLENEIEIVKQQRDAYKESYLALQTLIKNLTLLY